ncbi:MAG: FxsA family protein [Rhodobacteraceae bacterium]|nr:FxsA family protein [Paracoccaceae bacterium]
MPLFLVFLIVPLIEIGLFIQIGGIIGLWPTLGIVVLTAILGTYLVREQGLRALADVQQSFQQLDNPSEPLAHGAMILFSGALLLTPGFFTDAVGFALLAPPVRRWLYRYISSRVQARGNVNMTFTTTTGAGSRNDQTIDVEFEEVEIKPGDPNSPSGWTKH